MTLTVHHLQVSQSERIIWLCEELGIPYKLALYKRDPLLSPPELKALTPMGSAPVIEDTSAPYSEASPLVMGESSAIVEYITHKYGGGQLTLSPSDKNYADYLYWFHYSNSTLQPGATRNMTIKMMKPKPDDPTWSRYQGRFQSMLKQIDDRLSTNQWLAGDEFTVADIMTVFTLTTMRVFYSLPLKGYDGILAYLQRVGQRPAYQRAMQKGDPDMAPALQAEPPPVFEALAAIL